MKIMKIYCPKCKGKREITDSEDGVPPGVSKMKNDRYRLSAYCGECGTKVGRFLSGSNDAQLIKAYEAAVSETSGPNKSTIPVNVVGDEPKGGKKWLDRKKELRSKKELPIRRGSEKRKLSKKSGKRQKLKRSPNELT